MKLGQGKSNMKTQKSENLKLLKTAVIGSSIMMWIVSVFLVYTLNGIKSELGHLSNEVDETNRQLQDARTIGFSTIDTRGNVYYTKMGAPAASHLGGIPLNSSSQEEETYSEAVIRNGRMVYPSTRNPPTLPRNHPLSFLSCPRSFLPSFPLRYRCQQVFAPLRQMSNHRIP